MSTFVLPTPIGGLGGGGGEGTPGPAGKSAYQLAVQEGFTGTLEEWLLSLHGGDGADGADGTNGADGKSVELQKTETAIQWRQEGGAFADLFTLAELAEFPISEGPGYSDFGIIRVAWGAADSSGAPLETFTFPIEFGNPPSVQVNRSTVGTALIPSNIDKFGFKIARTERYANPVPFTWMAIGLKTAPPVSPLPPVGFDIAALPTWSAALRAQRAGKRQARILCIGDSTTAGYGAVGAGMTANDIAASYPKTLADILTARGSKGNWQNALGTHAAPTPSAFDSRVSNGASWTPTATSRTIGGPTFVTGGTPTNFSFTPTEAWDTAEIYCARGDYQNGTAFDVSINGTAHTTISMYNPPGSPAVSDPHLITVGSAGLHTLGLRAVNTYNTYVLGILTYKADVKDVLILNGGWSGSKSVDWLQEPTLAYAPMPIMPLYNPDLVLINLGINDMGHAAQAPTKAIYQAQMQQIINASKASGADVILIIPNDCNPADLSTRLVTLASWISELATLNGLLCIDLRTKLGMIAAATAAGYMRDSAHPNALGYSKIAEAIADVIMPVGA